MQLAIVAGTAGEPLARRVTGELGLELTPCEVQRFPDGEIRPVVGSRRGDDVYVLQPTGPPGGENLLELLLLLDACRRSGAGRVTAVVPYFGYARQDRRVRAGEALGARVVADAITVAGADRVVVIDPHTTTLEAMFQIPVEMLTAVPVLAEALAPVARAGSVVVAPDLGAAKLAEHYASLLGLSVAVVRKTRMSGSAVHAEELIGDVDGRPVVIVDDMISTAATIEAAATVTLEHGALRDLVVAATHGLFVGPCSERLSGLPIDRMFVTDSLPSPSPSPTSVSADVVSIGPTLANAVLRMHRNESLDDLLVRT